MESPVKKINKWLIGIIIGGTLLGLTSLQKGEQGRGILGRGLHAFVAFGRRLLDQAERRGTALGGNKSIENTPEKVKHESDVV